MKYSLFSVQDHYSAQARTIGEFYREVMAQCELGEELGYDSFFVAEHHFHEYGTVPNPAVLLAALSQRTRRIRLGPAISVLTYHNPLTVAENYAMVDVLSGGRLVLGVGSGYLKHEFEGYRIDPAEKRDRFDENLEIFRRALAGETVVFEGKYRKLDGVAINVPTVQRPRPPLYIGILRMEAAFHVGLRGDNIMTVPYGSLERFEEIAGLVTEYRRGRAEAGLDADSGDALFALHTSVAESDEEARRQAAASFDLYVKTRLYAKRQTYSDIVRSGLALFGSVETVAEKMVRLHNMGVRHVMSLQNFGNLPADAVRRSMQLFAEEVMPRVRKRLGL